MGLSRAWACLGAGHWGQELDIQMEMCVWGFWLAAPMGCVCRWPCLWCSALPWCSPGLLLSWSLFNNAISKSHSPCYYQKNTLKAQGSRFLNLLVQISTFLSRGYEKMAYSVPGPSPRPLTFSSSVYIIMLFSYGVLKNKGKPGTFAGVTIASLSTTATYLI